MPFDANLILMDGSVITTVDLDTPATSTTRDATTGAVVLDLEGSGARGLAAVLILSELADAADAYTLTAFIEGSDVLAFTSDIHRLCSFDLLGTAGGVIVGSETPCTVVARFATNERYIRINATVSNTFGYITALISPYPFILL